MAVDDPLPRPFGPYVLEQFIAAGGMARVYRARRSDGQEPVIQVVKLMRSEISEEEQGPAMFRDEARLAHLLVHANIVRVFDYGEIDGALFMAMELVDGPSISALMRWLAGPMSPRAALLITIELCEALQHAHTVKDPWTGKPLALVHRDVSPQNILLTSSGVLKLADFGIAKAAFGREAQTRTNYIKGKIGYMSPEQLLGKSLDHRSDQFSAAILLWEMLSGMRLFREKTDALNMQKVIYGQAERPSFMNRALPGALDEVVMRALEKDPANRYPDMHAFSRTLRVALTRFPAGPDDGVAHLVSKMLGKPPPPVRSAVAEDELSSQPTVHVPSAFSVAPQSPSPSPSPASPPSLSPSSPSSSSSPSSASLPSAEASGPHRGSGSGPRPVSGTAPRPITSESGRTARLTENTAARSGSGSREVRTGETTIAASSGPPMPRTSGLPVAFVVATVVIAAAAFVGGRFTAGEGPDPCGTISTEPKKIDAAYDLALEGQRMMEAGNIVDAVKKGQLSLVSSATGKAHFVLARSAFIEHRDKDAFFHMMCTSRLDPEGDEVRWALEKIRRRD